MTSDIKHLSQLSLEDLQAAYQQRQLSPVDVVEASLNQIESTNDEINALYGVRAEEALLEAQLAEARYSSGDSLGPFDGVPVTLKDSVQAIGMRWHHGSAIHGEGVVATADAPPTTRLKQAGAIILGKCAMPDFGLSGSGVSGSHGIVRNPWGLKWNTGGSSAGGGASIAAGIGMMSVGSDIAGSVRLPAAHCGLAAIKPTQGVIAHTPASTVRSAGPITRRAADLKAWTKLLSGPHKDDRYSVPYCNAQHDSLLRVGASADFGFGPNVESAVLACFENVKLAMAELVGPIIEVDKGAGFDAYLPIDNSLKLRGWLEYSSAAPQLRDHTPASLLQWFRAAEQWSPSDLREIENGIERGVAYCVDLLSDIDFLLTPVMPVVNFPAEHRGIDADMPLRHTTFTALFNQSGHPAVAICAGFDKRGLPIGVQIVGKRFDDDRLLTLATQLERALDLCAGGPHDWPVTPIH